LEFLLLSNIFLLIGKSFYDLNDLDIYSYPDDITKKRDADFIHRVIFGHDHNSDPILTNYDSSQTLEFEHFEMDCPVSQIVDDLNVYTICINSKMIIGLILEKDDNPYDYKEIFEELSFDLLNNEKCCSFEDEIEIENFLITLFIDIRRYGDEFIKKTPEISFATGIFTKVFLFGIDDVGKSSFVRRLKTGKFNDNYLAPTRKFNIEYIQDNEGRGGLAIWDLPGQRTFREKWLTGIQDSNLIIYMIDVANQLRFEEARRELWNLIKRYDLSEVPIIILGNKVDLINIKDNNGDQLHRRMQEIIDFFELDKLDNKDWKFLFTSVKTNYNIKEVMQTIFDLI
jgi:ADP-ribosylation factor-like protein 8